MTLVEIGTILGQELEFSVTSDGNTFHVSFRRLETKEHPEAGTLRGEFGRGSTKKEALADYAASLCGKWIVLNARDHKEKRREFQLPPIVTP